MSGRAWGCGHAGERGTALLLPGEGGSAWGHAGVALGGCGPVGTSCWWHSQHWVAKGEQWLRDGQSVARSRPQLQTPQGIEVGGTDPSRDGQNCAKSA